MRRLPGLGGMRQAQIVSAHIRLIQARHTAQLCATLYTTIFLTDML